MWRGVCRDIWLATDWTVSRARCHWLAVGASRSACIFAVTGCDGPVVGPYANGSDVKRQVEAGGPMGGSRIPFGVLGCSSILT